jgi:hypothetical protein
MRTKSASQGDRLSFIDFQLPSLVDMPPQGDGWIHPYSGSSSQPDACGGSTYPPRRFTPNQIRNSALQRQATIAPKISHSSIVATMPLEHSRAHMQIR